MDPNETYRRVKAGVEDYERARLDADKADAGLDVTIAFNDLDGWLKSGGFLPDEWQPSRPKGWALVQVDASTYRVSLNGKTVTTIKYDGRGLSARWNFYSAEFGVEYYGHPWVAFGAIVSRYEGRG